MDLDLLGGKHTKSIRVRVSPELETKIIEEANKRGIDTSKLTRIALVKELTDVE